jgi:hypothetical protein
MPLPRMTTRRWMVAVALVALVCAAAAILAERSRRFDRIARQHSELIRPFSWHDLAWREESEIEGRLTGSDRVHAWHLEMATKYLHAARYTWLPVEPDPPEPE